MNAAFVLLTSACLTGAEPVPAGVHLRPVSHAAPAAGCDGCSGGISGGCDACCEKPSLKDRLKARFQRADDCCEAKPSLRDRLAAKFHRDSCDAGCVAPCQTSSYGCDSGCGLMSRLRGLFHRNKDCCEAACDGCSGSAQPIHSAPAAVLSPAPASTIISPAPAQKIEPIPAPKGGEMKKMPEGGAKPDAGKSAYNIPAPLVPRATLSLER